MPPVVPLLVTASQAASEDAVHASVPEKLSLIVSVRLSAVPVGVLANPTPHSEESRRRWSALRLTVRGSTTVSPLTVAVTETLAEVDPGVTLAEFGAMERAVPV